MTLDAVVLSLLSLLSLLLLLLPLSSVSGVVVRDYDNYYGYYSGSYGYDSDGYEWDASRTSPAGLFEPSQSTTFQLAHPAQPEWNTAYNVEYQDGTVLKGYKGEDTVELASLSGTAEFMGITQSSGVAFGDGVLGLGLFDRATSKPTFKPVLPSLWSSSNTDVSQRNIGVYLNQETGYLLLGEIDPTSYEGDLVDVPQAQQCLESSCPTTQYEVELDSVAIQDDVIFDSGTDGTLRAVLDSGSTCIIFQTGGPLNMWERFKNAYPQDAFDSEPSLFFSIGGVAFEIPFDVYVAGTYSYDESSSLDDICVVSYAGDEDLVILGTVFFQTAVVWHDLSDMDNVRIKLGSLNPDFCPETYQGTSQQLRPQILRQDQTKHRNRPFRTLRSDSSYSYSDSSLYPAEALSLRVDLSLLVYFVKIHVGSPSQGPYHVQIDTGSSPFTLLSQKSPMSPKLIAAIVVPVVLFVLIMIGIYVVVVYRDPIRKFFHQKPVAPASSASASAARSDSKAGPASSLSDLN